jgi:hypothetical protein
MKHKNKIKRLETRRADYWKTMERLSHEIGGEEKKKGFTIPGSLKK